MLTSSSLKTIFLAHPDLAIRSKAGRLILEYGKEKNDPQIIRWYLDNVELDRQNRKNAEMILSNALRASILLAANSKNLAFLAKIVTNQTIEEPIRLEAGHLLIRSLKSAQSSSFTSGTIPSALFHITSDEAYSPHQRLLAKDILSDSAFSAIAENQARHSTASLLRIARHPLIPDTDREEAAKEAFGLVSEKDPSALFVLASDRSLPEGVNSAASEQILSSSLKENDLRSLLLLWASTHDSNLKNEIRDHLNASGESDAKKAMESISIKLLAQLSCESRIPNHVRWSAISEILRRLDLVSLSEDDLIEIILADPIEWILYSRASSKLSTLAVSYAKSLENIRKKVQDPSSQLSLDKFIQV